MNNHFIDLKKYRTVISTVVCAILLSTPFSSNAADYTKYHNYAEFTKALKDLVNSHKNIAKIKSIGKSLEGRDIWAVEIANPSGVPVDKRPGIFIGGNFEGDHVIGSEIALYNIEHLLTGYGTDTEITNRLDNFVIYVIPRVNPDGAEKMFAAVKTGSKGNSRPSDDDNDGRIDEDGPDDLNGDGQITMMRVLDSEGKYMIDPDDARLMKKADAKKGESGKYSIYWEGIDNDNDGFINEDPKGGVDINRNFQHEYPYYKFGSGPHMVSELESRAVIDYIISKKNVGIILAFGESDNLFAAPNAKGELGKAVTSNLVNFADMSNSGSTTVGNFRFASGRGFGGFGGGGRNSAPKARRPQTVFPKDKVDKGDISYFTTLSKEYKKITGLKELPQTRKAGGAFFQYGYYQFGVPSLSTPGWDISVAKEEDEKGKGETKDKGGKKSFDKKLIDWMDAENVDGFVEWTKFDHPTLGEVEIGGFKPYSVTNPPASKIADAGKSHSEFVMYLTSLFPKVEISSTEVTDHGSGVYRIKVEIKNTGFLPTSLAHGRVSGAVSPTRVVLGVKTEDIISGNSKTSYFRVLAGSGGVQTYEWIIKGKNNQKVTLDVISQKSGSVSTTITLKK